VALPFTLKIILKQKKKYGNSNVSQYWLFFGRIFATWRQKKKKLANPTKEVLRLKNIRHILTKKLRSRQI
jgi:hypothetical protein